MANKLKPTELPSVDLCRKGANQKANIKLFKSAEAEGGGDGNEEMGLIDKLAKALAQTLGRAFEEKMQPITKADSAGQIRETTGALRKSLESILEDDTLSSVEKHDMMADSLQQFTLEATDLMDGWAQASGFFKAEDQDPDFDDGDPDDEDEAPEDEPMDDDDDLENDPDDDPDDDEEDDEDEPVGKNKSGCKPGIKKTEGKGVFDMATIDINKMSPEDKAVLEALEKKYAAEPDTIIQEGLGEMHPDVQKALDEVQELRKSLELKELEGVAKKYEVIGKKAPELAQKLYDLKKAGEQHYNDYVALLDEQVQMSNSGIFKEYGTSRGGGPSDLDATVAELRKADPSLTQAQAIVKAYETNPALDPFTGRVK